MSSEITEEVNSDEKPTKENPSPSKEKKDKKLMCDVCQSFGHKTSICPTMEDLPYFQNIPDKMDAAHLEQLDNLFITLYNQQRMTAETSNIHSCIVGDLQGFLRQRGHELARVELFGSSRNGFGANYCDLDLCLTFDNDDTGDGLNFVRVIENLREVLRGHPNIDKSSIKAVTTAKVPIVKFIYVVGTRSFQCDISLYNVLAKENTRLLRTYSMIDERVSILGFVVKNFAKFCQIGDAAKGSLSSYAYTLMTLHYLQQISPPVIPVLQELYDGEEKPEAMTDGWNTWFYDDLNNLPTVWQYLGQNKAYVAELFVGFLRYYTEKFEFENDVVCTRQIDPLSRVEKFWTVRKIAIEDPFLLDHNLGKGVSNDMATYIKIVFRLGRNHFGKYPANPNFGLLPMNAHFLYYFNIRFLTPGQAPTSGRCRYCGTIGHVMRNCEQNPKGRPLPVNQDSPRNQRRINKGNGKPEREQRNNGPTIERPRDAVSVSPAILPSKDVDSVNMRPVTDARAPVAQPGPNSAQQPRPDLNDVIGLFKQIGISPTIRSPGQVNHSDG
ncbi:Terminal uridylyltransferase 7 [Halotydeus destructor]|nr:Terminal uridylyltransferase 7 [Halotydeus destructor]